MYCYTCIYTYAFDVCLINWIWFDNLIIMSLAWVYEVAESEHAYISGGWWKLVQVARLPIIRPGVLLCCYTVARACLPLACWLACGLAGASLDIAAAVDTWLLRHLFINSLSTWFLFMELFSSKQVSKVLHVLAVRWSHSRQIIMRLKLLAQYEIKVK